MRAVKVEREILAMTFRKAKILAIEKVFGELKVFSKSEIAIH
jgi:hypothetical protein